MTAKNKLVCNLLVYIVLLDQASKAIVSRMMPLNHSIPVIENLFNLTYIRNTGAAFGILAQSDALFRLPFLVLFSLFAIGFIVVMLRRLPEREKWLITALTFIMGGAVGNLLDRLFYGEVIDFLDFYWSRFHWPTFNFADSFISLGVMIILYRLVRAKGGDPFSPQENN
ncbi:MAG: signal peptidase II [Candidatus Binatia bacterium]